MNIISIISKPELGDIPIMYILRVINAIQSDYIHDSAKENLEILLSTIRKMLSELYVTCDLDEKEIFKKHLETLQNITQPNII